MQKQCSKCKIFKDINDFYNDKSKKDGKSCQCKVCKNSKRKIIKRSIDTTPIFELKSKEEKFCSACGEFVKLNQFNKETCLTCSSKGSTTKMFCLINDNFEKIKELLQNKHITSVKIRCIKNVLINHYSLEVNHKDNMLYYGLGYNLNSLENKAINHLQKIKNYDYEKWDNYTSSNN